MYVNEILFSYARLYTGPHFEREAKGNTDLDYSLYSTTVVNISIDSFIQCMNDEERNLLLQTSLPLIHYFIVSLLRSYARSFVRSSIRSFARPVRSVRPFFPLFTYSFIYLKTSTLLCRHFCNKIHLYCFVWLLNNFLKSALCKI